jgi:hypothetical protein
MPTPKPMSLTVARVLPLLAAASPASLQAGPVQLELTVCFLLKTRMPVTEPSAMPATPKPPAT